MTTVQTHCSHESAGQQVIWDFYQSEAPSSFDGSLNRLTYLARLARPFSKVLNIGIGGGQFEKVALQLGIDIHSLDPNERAVLALRQRFALGEKAKTGLIEAIPFADRSFGAVVVSEVFEHLTRPSLAASVQEIRRVLQPGGVLLGTVPAREDLLQQMVVCPGCGVRFHRWGHHQSFTRDSMRALLQPDLEVRAVYERYFAPWNILNWKGRLLACPKVIWSRLGPPVSGANVVFCAARGVR